MKVLIVGGGNMGFTYAKSLVNNHIVKPENLSILERSEEKRLFLNESGFKNCFIEPGVYIVESDLIILAVKPQDSSILFKTIQPFIDRQQLILSIMAGLPVEKISKALKTQKVIRAMPNLPAQVGSGMTVYTSASQVTRIELVMVQNILNSTGKTIYVENEDLIDASTAISGSGPAYVYYFIKTMIDSAQDMGFTQSQAELLAYSTFKGAIDLYNKNNLTCEEWIKMVASKGGTTEAALEEFLRENIDQKIQKAYIKAYQRAKQLSK
jgi:pyrroline-5-carboxylate reductase